MLRIFENTSVLTWTAARAANRVSCSDNDYAVEVSDLTAVYGRVEVLCNVGLTIAQGESVAVIGPNGAGKSTLLKCIAGAVRPVAGCIRWFGDATPRRDILCRKIGYVGQQEGLYAELTALENLLFAGRMNGVANIHDRAGALLADAALELQAHRPARQLSQGMRQRLAIARSVVHEPKLVLLDDPSSSLDTVGCQWLTQLFRRWRRAGQTVCFVSHDATLTRNLADRVVQLEAGRIVGIERGSRPPTTLQRSA